MSINLLAFSRENLLLSSTIRAELEILSSYLSSEGGRFGGGRVCGGHFASSLFFIDECTLDWYELELFESDE